MKILIRKSEIENQKMVARLGFEPRQTDSESAVLPLHHRANRRFDRLVVSSFESRN